MKTLHALMIAINDYPNPRHKLRGCLNDMHDFKSYLTENFNLIEQDDEKVKANGKAKGEKLNLRIKQLTNASAYRQNVIDGFDHFKKAKDGDICLLYYSGHGSRVKSPPEFWSESPNRMLETIVCHDSRLPGGMDLVDKELRYLIWNATKKKDVHFVAVMDCCHAGSVTRDTEVTSRMADPSPIPKNFKDFVGYNAFEKVELEGGDFEYKLPIAENFIALGAAQNKQTAKELLINGVGRGIFTYSLVETLKKTGGQINYLDLMDRLSVVIGYNVDDQSPQLEATRTEDKVRRFLDGGVAKSSPNCMVYYDDQDHHNWVVNRGAIQGINPSIDGEDTIIQLKEGKVELKITEVFGNKSLVSGMSNRMERKPYEAVIKSQASPRINIAFDADCNAEAKANIEELLPEGKSKYFKITALKNADYVIKSSENELMLVKPKGIRPQFETIKGFTKPFAGQFVDAVDKIGRWRNILDFSNPNSTIEDGEIELELSRVTDIGNLNDNAPSEVVEWRNKPVFRYELKNGKWVAPALKIKVANKSHRNLWVSGVLLSDDFAISNQYLKKEELNTGNEAKFKELYKGKEYEVIPFQFHPSYLDWDITEISVHIKVIISTDELNTDHLNQKGLERAVRTTKTRSAMGRGGGIEQPDWVTKDIEIILVRPKESQELSKGIASTLNGITIEGHPDFEAKVTLAPTTESTRAVGVPPPHQVAGLENMFPLELTSGNKNTPGLSVMEFYKSSGTDKVNADNPLIMRLDQGLAEDETILPIGYDEETGLYYPLGEMDEDGRIIIEDLPDETAAGTRSLGGSIKIFFQKVVLTKLGLYSYPSLQMSNVDQFEEHVYEPDKNKIKAAVAEADSVVMFIHGIIGDTMEMTKAVQRAKNEAGETVNDKYDLVLSFDYENLSTEINQTAKDLKQCLGEIGLSAGHGKTFHIVAHSMGGLVSRWFIEQEGGNEIVSHLIQLGTPNGGSEWASVQEMATTLMARAINGASFLQPWLTPLAIASRYLKQVFICLQQMKPGSPFLTELNSGVDPGIPYTIIAGDTSQIPSHYTETRKGLFRKIINRFKGGGHYKALDLVLFKEANDIAVRVSSIQEIPDKENRAYPPEVIEIPCDHISYFADDNGLKALAATVFKLQEASEEGV